MRNVRVQSGSAGAPFQAVVADTTGRYQVQFPASGRLAIDLGESVEAGYQVVGDELRALPAGSTLDAAGATFAWMPPLPFLGLFRLVFVSGNDGIDVTAAITDPSVKHELAPARRHA